MTRPLVFHDDRLFPADERTRGIARALYGQVKGLPIISPHGHTDPAWFATNAPFEDATDLLLAPDHYLYRMLYSQGISLDALKVRSKAGVPATDPREAWRLLAQNFHLFRGTPSWLWLNHVFSQVFGFTQFLSAETSDDYFDRINEALATEAFRPRALFDRFNIETLATTEGPQDRLEHHKAIRESGWGGHVITAYRPDAVIDFEDERFGRAFERFGEVSGQDVTTWKGYLEGHRLRRAAFIEAGATSSATTAIRPPPPPTFPKSRPRPCSRSLLKGEVTPAKAELFRAQMLTEMARMSLDDGLVMQIHPGSHRNHNVGLLASHGRDKGADIPMRTEYVDALKPLLTKFGNDPRLSIILFTLDETVYSRELAPLAGHYPVLKLGPSWWFHDSPEGMMRFREQVTETAGFYNTVGFNDDTRAFLSIPARHDVARRVDSAFLARMVAEHRMDEVEAAELIVDLTYTLPKKRLQTRPTSRLGPWAKPVSQALA
jgi:glucuronate isomerase